MIACVFGHVTTHGERKRERERERKKKESENNDTVTKTLKMDRFPEIKMKNEMEKEMTENQKNMITT